MCPLLLYFRTFYYIKFTYLLLQLHYVVGLLRTMILCSCWIGHLIGNTWSEAWYLIKREATS